MTGKLFSEFKIQYQRDSTPAPDAEKNDMFPVLCGRTI